MHLFKLGISTKKDYWHNVSKDFGYETEFSDDCETITKEDNL